MKTKHSQNMLLTRPVWISFSRQEQIEIDIEVAVLIAIGSITEDRIMRLGNMIKSSETEEGRQKYCIRRNYHYHQGKQLPQMLYNVCRLYDRQIVMVIKEAAKQNEIEHEIENYKYHSCDMVDFSDEYLKHEFEQLRSMVRKSVKECTDVEDLTMVGRIAEASILTNIGQTVWEHFCKITPKIGQTVRFGVFNSLNFANAIRSAAGKIDVRDANGNHLKMDVIIEKVKEDVSQHIEEIKSKIYHLDFVNRLIEARNGIAPEYEQIGITEWALRDGFPKLDESLIEMDHERYRETSERSREA